VRPFSYSAPATLEEALGSLDEATRPLAGGTDLLTLMKGDIAAPARLLAVSRLLPKGIDAGPDGLEIGAATTLAEIEADPIVSQRYSALAQAATVAATAQLRNMATLGGNLLQRPRCWYFRNAHVPCWLKGGTECQAREGENRLHALFGADSCVAVHPSDLAPALVALDAQVRVRGAQAERALALGDFFAPPEGHRRTETTLRSDELLLAVRIPQPAQGTRSVYLKAMDRAAFSFALAGVAAVLCVSPARRIQHARLVLAGVAPIPWRARAAEQILVGAEPGERTLEDAAQAALHGARALRRNAWKIPLARVLVKRALQAALR
jgi:xanthine dehydrogenase YagS FAD-binding subunit